MGIYCEYITLPHEIIVQPDSFVNSFILIFFFFFFFHYHGQFIFCYSINVGGTVASQLACSSLD